MKVTIDSRAAKEYNRAKVNKPGLENIMTEIVAWKFNSLIDEQKNITTVTFDEAPASLNAGSKQLPKGVYTTFRTYEGNKALLLDDHLRRLETSASLVNVPISLNFPLIKQVLRQVIQSFPAQDTRVRLSVDLEESPGTTYVLLEPLHTPSIEDYENGVRVVTCQFQRENPQAKQTAFISLAESLRSILPLDTSEGLLIDEKGRILEGLSSNFFAVKNGEIWTAEDSVLPGITRGLIFQVAKLENIPIRLNNISVSELAELQEAFLTSSSRSVLPIRQIDQILIGNGKPGPITTLLADAYWREIRPLLKEI